MERTLKSSLTGWVLISLLVITGCSSFLDYTLKHTVDPETGSISLPGLHNKVLIRRDELGIPLIEADNFDDMAFATGYVMASDRLAQMVSFSLLGQGRLSEMAGPLTLDIDIYVRTLGTAEVARKDYEQLSDELKAGLVSFSKGVNAYIETHTDRLPLDFKLSGYTPEPWLPINSLYIAHALNLGLSFNLAEEIAFLNIAKKVGPHQAAWLIPIYPDEALSFDEADALNSLDFKRMDQTGEKLSRMYQKLNQMMMGSNIPASNNWGIAPCLTKSHASIIANDTHLPLEMPSIWMMLHMKSPQFDSAGIAIAGVPCIIAGYNGHIAWGETMVMGDTQDVFIEQLKSDHGKNFYLYEGDWLPVSEHQEVFKIHGEKDEIRSISSTRHGPLINSALQNQPKDIAFPPRIEFPYGLAVRTTLSESDRSFSAMFDLTRATTMEEAHQAIRDVRFMALNFIYGNDQHIAWQVSGRYPQRKAGRGHFPVIGWTGDYDWEGYVDVNNQPYILDPDAGFFCTANNRTISPDQHLILSSTWYAPERAERIEEMIRDRKDHTWQTSAAMQFDRYDPFVKKMQKVLFESSLSAEIEKEIGSWHNADKAEKAKEAMEILKSFDGEMSPDSKAAAVFGVFQNVFVHDVFFDELGPEDSPAWISFKYTFQGFYGADQDHLLGREDSPFWDDISTPERETKAQILARVLSDTIVETEKLLGGNRQNWKWGRLLNYQWRTQTTKMRPYLSFLKRLAVEFIGRYTDRGPYPAGGDYNTVNVSGFHKGDDYDVWLIPEMRLLVDFGSDEPMYLINSSGQSGNPVSRHYDDGITVWLNGETRSMPFKNENIQKQYVHEFVLQPKP